MVTGSSSMAEDSPLPRPNVWTDQVEARCFAWRALPTELQQSIIALAVQPGSCVSIVALLCTCRSIYNLALPVVYSHINLSSITQTVALLDGKSLDREKERNKLVAESGDGPSGTATKHARCFSFSLVGVPGGNPRGGRESALSSPERRERAQQDNDSSARSNARPSEAGQTVSGSITSALGNERLLLAARAMLLCPMLEQCSISMFGKRHSFLTSPAYLADEAGSFRDALAQLQHLRSFAWVTPRENDNFVGFSVAVVDLAFPPMIEGLQTAALDMTADGRRVKRPVGALDRYAHPLESITLHHAIFPTSKYPRDSFFCLFAQGHPDDSDWALFPRLYRIVIRTACNINPRDVAYLALSWQLRVDKAMQEMLSAVEQYQLNCSPEWNPVMELSDVFVNRCVKGFLRREKLLGRCHSGKLTRLLCSCFLRPSEPVAASGVRASRLNRCERR